MAQPMSSMTPKFFGLTALGAPDSWHLNLNGTVMINIFTADDVAAAYKRTERIEGKAKAKGAVLGDFLTELYRGEYPPVELQRLKEIVSRSVTNSSGELVPPEEFDELVGLAVLEDAVEQLKQVAEEQVTDSVYNMGSGSEHASNALFRAHRFKHTRLKEGPEAKYTKPATASQEVGWSAPAELTDTLKTKIHPKKSCAETKYQDALVKTGMTYR